MLAETVDVGIRWEGCLESKVLRLKDEGVRSGREEYFRGRGAEDGEREGGRGVVKLDLRRGRVDGFVRRRSWKHRVGNFVPYTVRVGDLDMDTRVYVTTSKG